MHSQEKFLATKPRVSPEYHQMLFQNKHINKQTKKGEGGEGNILTDGFFNIDYPRWGIKRIGFNFRNK